MKHSHYHPPILSQVTETEELDLDREDKENGPFPEMLPET